MVALALPGSLLVSPTFGYNFAMLLSFILSGWGMYLWVKTPTGDSWPGWCGERLCLICHFRMVHFVGWTPEPARDAMFPVLFFGPVRPAEAGEIFLEAQS